MHHNSLSPWSTFARYLTDRKTGTGFKYQVQGAFRAHKGVHRKTIDHVSDLERTKLFSILEDTARKVLSDLLSEAEEESPDEPKE